MERTDRTKLIKEIEGMRNSKLLAFITGDREGMPTRIANDMIPILHTHLLRICGQDRQERIDLFLYSVGGLTMAGYALVNLFREFCDEFNVIIPFKALSAATLIALGANEVVMTRMGQLSPIDPSLTHVLGPKVQMPGQEQEQLVPLNVEDVSGFVDLARKEFKLESEEAMSKVFGMLAERVDAVALGAVHRAREQIAFLASRLLKYHNDDEDRIKHIVDTLTRERFSHSYIIGRSEAKETLKLNIIEPNGPLTDHITSLFGAYSEITELDTPYNPELILGQSDKKEVTLNCALIESTEVTHVFRQKRELKKIKIAQKKGSPPKTGCQDRVMQSRWLLDDTI